MDTEKKNKEVEYDEFNEPVHVHGPNCNHHHHKLAPIQNNSPKVGRNDPCVCGSGKKSKKCCG